MVNITNLDPNKTMIDEKSNKNIVVYQIGYMTVKNLKILEIDNSVEFHQIFRLNFPSEMVDGKFNQNISVLLNLKSYLVVLQYA